MTDDTPKSEKPLTPANQNPWYILMTLHGEQPEGATLLSYDAALHAKNRRDWNRWAARGLTDTKREELLRARNTNDEPFFNHVDLQPFTDNEHLGIEERFIKVSNERGYKLEFPSFYQFYNLRNIIFSRQILMSGVIFPNDMDLSGSVFSSAAGLMGANFFGKSFFTNTTFAGDAIFENANFSGDSYFIRAFFSRNASFMGAVFHKNALHTGATFNEMGDFASVKFSRNHLTHIGRAIFKDRARFLNTELEGQTSFVGTTFEKHPPSFHGAKLNEGAAFHGVRWPEPPAVPATTSRPLTDGENAKRDAAREAAQQHVYNYQRLKQIMEGLKKHEDELNFFAMEMAAQRVVDGECSMRGILNGLYGAVSDYGRSILRPALAFFPFFAVSAPVFEQSARIGEGCSPLSGAQAAGVSLATFLSVLPGLKDTINYKCLSTFATFTAGFNAIVGAVLLFLIGLGLRNRFRMK